MVIKRVRLRLSGRNFVQPIRRLGWWGGLGLLTTIVIIAHAIQATPIAHQADRPAVQTAWAIQSTPDFPPELRVPTRRSAGRR
jgi:hypothetical protein